MNAPKHLDRYPVGTRLISRFKHRLMNSKKNDEGIHIYARVIKIDPNDKLFTYMVQTSDNCKKWYSEMDLMSQYKRVVDQPINAPAGTQVETPAEPETSGAA